MSIHLIYFGLCSNDDILYPEERKRQKGMCVRSGSLQTMSVAVVAYTLRESCPNHLQQWYSLVSSLVLQNLWDVMSPI